MNKQTRKFLIRGFQCLIVAEILVIGILVWTHRSPIQQKWQIAAKEALPEDNCNADGHAEYGRTLMLSDNKDVVFGISPMKTTFKVGNEIGFDIRVDNRTDTQKTIESCPIAIDGVAYDQNGILVGQKSDYFYPLSCRFTYEINIPPHSCLFEKRYPDGSSQDFAKAYVHKSLAVGTYDIVFPPGGEYPKHKPPGPSLRITVE